MTSWLLSRRKVLESDRSLVGAHLVGHQHVPAVEQVELDRDPARPVPPLLRRRCTGTASTAESCGAMCRMYSSTTSLSSEHDHDQPGGLEQPLSAEAAAQVSSPVARGDPRGPVELDHRGRRTPGVPNARDHLGSGVLGGTRTSTDRPGARSESRARKCFVSSFRSALVCSSRVSASATAAGSWGCSRAGTPAR